MSRSLVASDDFNRAALGANWSSVGESPMVIDSSTKFRASHFGLTGLMKWVGAGSFTDAQYSSVLVTGLVNEGAGKGIGASIRVTGTDPTENCYFAYVESDAGSGGTHTIILGKVINAAVTSLTTTTAVVTDDVSTIEIEGEGTALRAYVSGVQVLSTTDADLATGIPGGYARSNVSNFGTSWEGGNLVAAASAASGQLGRSTFVMP